MDDDLDDYKLDTTWGQDPCHVIHASFEGDRRHGGRKVRVENKWYWQRELGVGSCGIVHLEATKDGQERAVKSIRKTLVDRLRINYRRELVAISTFSKAKYQQHQIFVEFLGWFENPEFIFIVMEYLPLGDLSNYISEDIKEHDLKDISSQLLEGLKLMHSKGFAHRDLKPQNIFIVQKTPSWWVKIGDFGIAKRVREGDTTELRTATGTDGYEAPEIRGYIEVEDDKPSSVYTNVVDIWSFGCVIYKVVAKQVPFANGREIKRFCENRVPFPVQSLEGKLTTNGIDFLQSILVANPPARPTAEIAIQHSWLLSSGKSVDSQLQQRAESLDEKAPSASVEASTANQNSATYRPERQECQGLGKGETQQGPENPINQQMKVIEIEHEGSTGLERRRRRIIGREGEVYSLTESERYGTQITAKRAPPLPAQTETETDTGLDLAADVSRVTDKESQTLPQDGSPVTIPVRKMRHDRDGESLTQTNSPQQISRPIECFEGGESIQANRRPSVRVKVTPYSMSRSRRINEYIKNTELKGTRKLSHTKRINLSSKDENIKIEGDNKGASSFASATEESYVSRNPTDIEIMPKRHGSPLIPTEAGSSKEVRIQQLGSDVSSMPADSFLVGKTRSPERKRGRSLARGEASLRDVPIKQLDSDVSSIPGYSILDGKTRSPERERGRSLARGEAMAAGAATGLAAGAIADILHAPSHRRRRSLSRERIVAQKVAEKVKVDKSDRRRKHSSRSWSRSVSMSEKHTESIKPRRRISSRSPGGDESLVSGRGMSHLTGSRLSADQRSSRLSVSKSSISNPKLLETVEDAIRQLILPELLALKKENASANRKNFERERNGSITLGRTGVSRDSGDADNELSSRLA